MYKDMQSLLLLCSVLLLVLPLFTILFCLHCEHRSAVASDTAHRVFFHLRSIIAITVTNDILKHTALLRTDTISSS